MPYLYEWSVSNKHAGELKCEQCAADANVQFLIQKKGQEKDYMKNYCNFCRHSMTQMYEALTGSKKESVVARSKTFC
jgi:hypothetical protein